MTIPQMTVVGNGVQRIGVNGRVAVELKNAANTVYEGAFNYYDNNVTEFTYDFNGNSMDENYMQLNEKAHNAFMSLVGDNEELELSDLNRLDNLAKQYSLDVDKTKIDKGEVKIKFADGQVLKLDFMTPEEQKEYSAKITNPVTETFKPIVKANVKAAEWSKDNIISPFLSWAADKIDTVLDRIDSWLNTP